MEEFRLWSNRYLEKIHLEDTQLLLVGLVFYIGLFIFMAYKGNILY